MEKVIQPSQIPHEILRQITQDFGVNILTENRLKGIISDLMTHNLKIKKIMVHAITDRLGVKLMALQEADDAELTIQLSNIKQSFQEDNFFQHKIASYVVDCFVYALGWIEELGEYIDDEPSATTDSSGFSFLQQEDGEYCGNFNDEQERSGFGILKKENNSYYVGEWKLNMQNGIGFSQDAERSKYAGEWRLNRSSGVGVKICTNGQRYAGEWKNGKMNGPGILFLPNGERICASFANGEIVDNYGIFYAKDGTFIIGAMTPQGPDKVCTHYFKDGSSQTENWINGIKTEEF